MIERSLASDVTDLLKHVGAIDRPGLDGPRFMTVRSPDGRDSYAVAMVIDGWYSDEEMAEGTIPVWQRSLEEVLESLDREDPRS